MIWLHHDMIPLKDNKLSYWISAEPYFYLVVRKHWHAAVIFPFHSQQESSHKFIAVLSHFLLSHFHLLLTAAQLSGSAAAELCFGQSHRRTTVMLHTWRLQVPGPAGGGIKRTAVEKCLWGNLWYPVTLPCSRPQTPDTPCVARGYTSQSLWRGIRCQDVFNAVDWLLRGQSYISQPHMEQRV